MRREDAAGVVKLEEALPWQEKKAAAAIFLITELLEPAAVTIFLQWRSVLGMQLLLAEN